MSRRRDVLRIGFGATASVLAGCSTIQGTSRETAGCGDAGQVLILRPSGEDVSSSTLEEIREIVRVRLRESGWTDVTVSIRETDDGTGMVAVEVPETDAFDEESARRLLGRRGRVTFRLTVDGEHTTLATSEDVADVGTTQEDRNGQAFVPITLTTEAADRFAERVLASDAEPDSQSTTIAVLLDGEPIYEGRIGRSLYETLEGSDFQGSFRVVAEEMQTARRVRVILESGAHPVAVEATAHSC